MFAKLVLQQRPLIYNQMRLFSSKQIFVSNLPKYWDQNEISTRFGIVGNVQQVNLIRNSLGQNSGKVIIKYQTEKQAKDAVLKFDNNAVDNLVCSARPYIEKGAQSERQEPSLLSRRVYLMNLPYDAHVKEIENLCKEFAPIDKVVVPRNHTDLSTGYAFVYLQNAKDVQNLIEFVDGRHIRGRQIRAKTSLGGDSLTKELNNLNPNDAELLARYQNYAKASINNKLNGFDESSEAQLEKSESYLAKALSREVQKLMKESNSSEQEAIQKVLQTRLLQPKELTPEYLSSLEEFIDSANTVKVQKFDEDETLKEMYPKSYMLSKMQQMISHKKGMSDFETYAGASEIFATETTQQLKEKKMVFNQPRTYDLKDL